MEILEKGNKNKKEPSEFPGKKRCPYCGCKFKYEDKEVSRVGNSNIVICPQCKKGVKVPTKYQCVMFYGILIPGFLAIVGVLIWVIIFSLSI